MSYRRAGTRQYQSYRSEDMESALPIHGMCGRRINYVLGAGILLALIGASLLVAFGLLYVRPYIDVRHLVLSRCVTTETIATGDTVICTCTGDDSGSCTSRYPCIHISVNYTTDYRDIVITNATLYDSYDTYLVQNSAQQCSYHKCDRVVQNNVDSVKAFADRFGDNGTTFVCYSDPNDPHFVIQEIVTKSTVANCMFWPLLALVVGLAIVLIYVFRVDSSSRDDNDGSSPLPSSLERRLVRVGDRTMILSGEEQAVQ